MGVLHTHPPPTRHLEGHPISRLTWPLSALLAIPLSISACGGSSAHGPTANPASHSAALSATNGADGVQQVTINTTDNFRFAPPSIQAKVGKLRIVLTNKGSYPHNISFPTLHATSSTVSGNPGQQQTTFTVTFTHAGTYDFVCTFHSSAGMKGRITVS
jgi:plastocyanin